MLKLQRSEFNPILTPTDLPWEDMLVFNPGAIMVEDKIYLIYRAMGKKDIHSRLGLATSSDGIHFERRQSPLYYGHGHPDESLGIEDPRIVKIDDTYYISYTAVSEDIHAEVNPNLKEKIAIINNSVIRYPNITKMGLPIFETRQIGIVIVYFHNKGAA